ncbi:MAG: hypothetical protein QXT63_07930, partial [Thermoplasmata archaeon]
MDKEKLYYTIINSKVGNLGIAATDLGLARIDFFPSQNYELKLSKFFDVKRDDSNRILNQTKRELKLY